MDRSHPLSRPDAWHLRVERILLTAWVGGMWAVGYLAVPVLFGQLEDRVLAGTVAGRMFFFTSYLGLFCGAGILYLGWHHYPRWRNLAVITMLVLVAIGQFGLQPEMAELRAAGLVEGSAERARFGMLHGIASVIFLLTSLLGLLLVVTGTRRRDPAAFD